MALDNAPSVSYEKHARIDEAHIYTQENGWLVGAILPSGSKITYVFNDPAEMLAALGQMLKIRIYENFESEPE